VKPFFLFLFCLVWTAVSGQNKFSFDGAKWTFSSDSITRLNTTAYAIQAERIEGIKGQAVSFSGKSGVALTNSMKGLQKSSSAGFTVSFFFSGKEFSFVSLPSQQFSLTFGYPFIAFGSPHVENTGKVGYDYFSLRLEGLDLPYSYNYLLSRKWNHIAFVFDARKGEKRIILNGKQISQGIKSGFTNRPFRFELLDGFKSASGVDELTFWTEPLQEGQIKTYLANFGFKEEVIEERNKVHSTSEDQLKYSPGYPSYTGTVMDQLSSVPSPRFQQNYGYKRNVSWVDITYLSRDPDKIQANGFGAERPRNAVDISLNLYNKWNYLVDVPLVRRPKEVASRTYNDTNSVVGAIAQLVKKNRLAYSVIAFQLQNNPSDAGFKFSRPAVVNGQLEDRLYFTDGRGKAILWNGRKWLSTITGAEAYRMDGAVSGYYVKNMLQELQLAPSLLNENGEVFGHRLPLDLLKLDNKILSDYQRSKMTVHQYSGLAQYKFDSAYKAALYQTSGLNERISPYSVYNYAAINPEYWPDYKIRRTINSRIGGELLSTPDFYPATPKNWLLGAGPLNGYNQIAQGRKTEIFELGQKYFSPFVSAGWNGEKDNILAGQWLGLLKSMLMLGADFFYTGYFNITGSNGKWANGIGPNDPRGYAYQLMMPAYAQALQIFTDPFVKGGKLLGEQEKIPFKIQGSRENDLIMVRKMGSDYLVFGAIMENSNEEKFKVLNRETSFQVEGNRITVPIRPQGSLFRINLAQNKIIQFDDWHEHLHPFYWSTDYCFQAENLNYGRFNWANITTIRNSKEKGDFNSFKSYLQLLPKMSVAQTVELNVGRYMAVFDFDRPSRDLKIEIILQTGMEQKKYTVTSSTLSQNKFSFVWDNKKNLPILLQIKVERGSVLLDKFEFKRASE